MKLKSTAYRLTKGLADINRHVILKKNIDSPLVINIEIDSLLVFGLLGE